MEIIEAKELTRAFKKIVAVDHASFTVREGEIFGFLGPNGAGKTTTIKMLTTLLPPTSGTAFVAGFNIVKNPQKVRGAIGLVPQELTADEDLTGMENMRLQTKLYGLSSSEAKRRITEVFELVGLASAANRKVDTYSGGMRKRLELALGLLHEPIVLFLDEPTLGLDVQTRHVIWKYIRSLRDQKGVTVFLTTHYMEEADYLCDRIVIMDHGKIIALDTPSRLKEALGGDILEIKLPLGSEDITQMLAALPVVEEVKKRSDGYRLKIAKGEEALPLLLEQLVKRNVHVSSVFLMKPTLDEVYLEYTGHSLRDEEENTYDARHRMMTLRRIRG